MGLGSRVILAVLLGLTAACVAACGSTGSSTRGYLSAAESRTISVRLKAVDAAVNAHSCARATSAVDRLSDYVTSLPSGVSQTLESNLGQGVSTVKGLAAGDCSATSTASSTASASSTPTTPTTTTTTTTLTTTTTETSSAPTSNTSTAATSTPSQTNTSSSGFDGGHAPINTITNEGG